MALSLYQKIFNKFFRRFTLQWGREPQSAKEWMDLRNLTTREINKTKGVPKKPPFQGWKPKVIQGGKGIESLIKSGDVKKGVAPKTTKETLKGKKDRHILFRDAEEDISRIKRENKQAIEDFKKKQAKKKTVEDFRDEGDFDPGGMASGGRIGLAGGGALFKFIEQLFMKASNDIRLGRGKWKGLDQKQIAVQHDNLTKKVVEFQKTKKLPEGTEQYFDVNPHEAFAATQKTVKKERTMDDLVEQAYDEIAGGSGFSGDIKYDADILASEIATTGGKIYDDLADVERMGIYDLAYSRMAKNLKAKMDFKKNLKDVEQKVELQMFDPKDRLPNQSGGPINQQALIQMYMEEGLSYDDAVAAAQSTSGLDMDLSKKADGGIARAGFPFGGQALKAIRAAWRANKTWGVGGPPYRPEKTSFDIKKLTKQNLGKELTLKELKEISESPFGDFASRGRHAPPKFEEFNKELKNIKASILKTKLEESKLMAESMIKSADMVPADTAIAKRIQAQFTRDGKKQLEEANEGLKAINLYKNMLQRQGRSLHQSGGLAYMLGEPTYMKYEGGGSVGHAPWLKPTAQPQPQQQQQQPGPAPQGGGQAPGRPNPMKAPRGLPSVAPRTMDPAVMQQQAMQKMMMGQGQQGQQQRPRMAEGGMTQEDFNRFLKEREEGYHEGGKHQLEKDWERYKRFKKYGPGSVQEAADGGRIGMMYGGDPGFQFEYGGSWADWRDQHQHQMPVTDYIKTKLPKERLPFRDPMIFGGSAGLKGFLKKIMQGRKQAFPKSLDREGKLIPDTWKKKVMPKEFKREQELKVLYLENILMGLQNDKKLIQSISSNRAMKDEGLNFLMKNLEETTAPHLKKYTDIDKDILNVEQMLANLSKKQGRRPNASGGIARLPLGLGSMSRRAFLKMLATLGIGTAVAKSGVSLLSKTAPKTIKAVETIKRGADGMPTYITDLIEVVKAKGTRDIIEGFKRSDYSTVHSYKGVDVIEDGAGNTRIKQGKETSLYGSDEPGYHEIEMEIRKGGYVKNKKGKMVKEGDEYVEYTAKPDMDGKLKDVDEYIDEMDHLELQAIADEIDTLEIPGYDRFSKASGGLAYALGE